MGFGSKIGIGISSAFGEDEDLKSKDATSDVNGMLIVFSLLNSISSSLLTY